ncbi:MAG: cell surface protein SprA, partial [Bacteroidia bacterium]|nr:cell surface protein SprA [Bacteroidia bacterium]
MKKSLPKFIALLLSVLWINSISASNITCKSENIKNKNSFYFFYPDSLSKAKDDSIRLYKLSIDSTARIEQFRFKQPPQQTINVIQKRKYSLLSYPPQSIFQRTVKMDSTGQYIIITEKVGDYELKPSLKIPIEQFIELKKASANRKLMEELGLKYELKQKGDDLGNLFKDLTNIVIPLPSSDVFSIFGPNKIELSVSGSVNILGAWKHEKTDGITTALNQNEQSAPDFKQQVQINVTGKIGDKLSILADWNTERQFDFENQLKINYKGYDDEIIQSIEAGNVSLQGSPLIGGSEALFGIKANLKFGPFTLTAIASQKKSEAQEMTISGGASSRTFEIRPNKYAENHFFLDKIYADTSPELNLFYKYYGESTPLRDDKVRFYEIKEIEVYKSDYRQAGEGVAQSFRASAFIDLKGKSKNDYGNRKIYDAEIKDSIGAVGEKEVRQNFSKLNAGTDYTINMSTGHLTIKTS